MKSVMGHQFSKVPNVEIQRSTFDRSHGHKTTFDAGWLIPVYVDEALPGDTFNMKMTAFARLATPLKPIMDNMYLDSFFFAVPYRLVWENWEKFNGATIPNPGSSTSFTVPQMTGPTAPDIVAMDLSDYMGIPTEIAAVVFNSLHHRAYNLIYNEWFRDQNLQNSSVVDVDDGPDTYADYVLLRRGKRHDYFTSCLPWPQKGDDVLLPLGTSAPITGLGIRNPGSSPGTQSVTWYTGASAGVTSPTAYVGLGGAAGGADDKAQIVIDKDSSNAGPEINADLTNATAATINALREAFQLQKLYEKDARGGTRYTEVVKAHFGVTSPDARLQRPEYLGGSSTPVNIHQVPQQSVTGSTPQGNLAAYGTATASGHGFTKSFTEHCLLLGIISVRADLTYQQGMNRMFSRRTRFDYFWPSLSHIGEQEVLNREIFLDMTANDALVFGYQERYAEYRYKPSLITGLFRSNATGTLDLWHLSQDFGALPTLGTVFIKDTPPVDRVIAVPAEPHFICDMYFDLKCARPMPLYGVPGFIDRF